MEDTETIKNYEHYFLQKLSTGKLHYDDYIFIKNFYYNPSFLLKLYSHILYSKQKYEIDPFEGYIKPIKNLKNIKRYHQTLKGTTFNDIISLLSLEEQYFLIDYNTPNYEKLLLYLKAK